MSLLPTKKTPPKDSLADISMLLYGMPGTGKSTLAAQFPDAVFLATEAGLNHLETYQVPIDSWKTLLLVLGELARGKHSFKTIVIDTLDNAARMCKDYVCEKLKVDDPSDLGFGKGFGAVNKEWHRVLTKLTNMPYGVVLISHAKKVSEEDPGASRGRNKDSAPPKELPGFRLTLTGKPREIATGIVDVIAFYVIDKKGRRVLRTASHELWDAKDRTGRIPDPLWLPILPEPIWPAVEAAFRGESLVPEPVDDEDAGDDQDAELQEAA